MNAKLLISVFGQDKPGLVKQISDVVKGSGGNWLESRLSHLGGRFAGLILAEFDVVHIDNAREALEKLSSEALSVSAETTESSKASSEIQLTLVGNDKPGIVYEITQSLNSINANVEQFNSEITPAPMSGGTLFTASIKVSLPQGVTLRDVRTCLEQVANDLMVDLDFE